MSGIGSVNEKVLAVIVNYDFSDNADDQKARLSPHFKTILVDNSSPVPPKSVDVVLPNCRYSGQWNEAVRLALAHKAEWLLLVASDIQIPDAGLLAACIEDVIDDPTVGIYTPSLTSESRVAFPACYNWGTGRIRECFLIEGFFFLARTEILEKMFPVRLEENKFGWGLDVIAVYHAYQTGRRAVVDDRLELFHPASVHSVPEEEARLQLLRYWPLEVRQFFNRVERRLHRRQQLARIKRRLKRALFKIVPGMQTASE